MLHRVSANCGLFTRATQEGLLSNRMSLGGSRARLPGAPPDGAPGAAQGNQCPYAHGVYERNLHPSKYRTQLCMEGERCARRVCFFAHSHAQLRMPVGAWSLEEAVRPHAYCAACALSSQPAALDGLRIR